MSLSRITVHSNYLYKVVHVPHLCAFYVYTKDGENYCADFGYSILAFPVLCWAKRAKKNAIERADFLCKLSRGVEG